jgi:undecaprenyl-diphosphatase
MKRCSALGLALTLAAGLTLHAPATRACVWEAIDHKIGHDESGPWNPSIYRGIVRGLTVLQVGGALWEGAESRFGRTMWQGIDSQLIGYGSAVAMKHIFTRERPRDTDDPCSFFAHGSNYSFPSEEAALSAALVTPYVLEYGGEHPATYGLLLLPLYVGVGRLKAQAHWQSDVLVGWAVGGLAGWYAHSRDVPILIQILPHGAMVGLKRSF